MSATKAKELKPCPFCGGKGLLVGLLSPIIYCEKCHAQTALHKNPVEAAKAWNRRAK